jgi:KaiC/GvpD/RAD55 family RecA-like ATPase
LDYFVYFDLCLAVTINMTQEELPISEINSHIEEYLDYYWGLSHAPGFAVLLKGEWGCGKTWFINKYREKLEKKKQKCLYVSLYGMTSFSEIESSFFQQLHPVLSSKGMAITGKIFQGLLKTSLKIDLNSDGKDDGSVSLQIPKIDLPKSFKKADERILIFDDLERCQIVTVQGGYEN